jgi:hypothetical protein
VVDPRKGLLVHFDERRDTVWTVDPNTGNARRNFAPARGTISIADETTPVISRVEIPQRSSLLAHLVLWFGSTGTEGRQPHLDSERFRSAPRTCRPFCGRIGVRKRIGGAYGATDEFAH